MPRTNALRSNGRIPSSLLTVFGLLGLIGLAAGSLNFIQPAAHAAAAFTVNSTGDGADSNTADGICNDGAGNCTLRAAIEQANATPGADTINFRIGAGVQTIVLGAILPDVSDPVVIDATTQPGYGGTPLVEIRGKDDGFTRLNWALHVTAGGSTVRALAVGRFEVAGILLGTEGANDAGGNKVESCYGGLRADGVTPAATPIYGTCVKIADSPNNTIGGTSAAARNVLSGCGMGVDVRGAKSTGNLIQGNYIGTNAAGTAAVGQESGIQIANASNNVIGGDTAAARNVISGNKGTGVRIAGSASGNAVKGNYIGTNAAGTAALPNRTGLEVFSANNVVGGLAPSPGVAPGNLISGQSTNLQINGTGVVVQGNLIGLDVTGSTGLSDSPFAFGVICYAPEVVIGGTQPGARNVISGLNTGIFIDNLGAPSVQGNYIGTDPSGTAARGNVLGINVDGRGSQIGGTAPGAGNLISGNRRGVLLRGGASTLQGNLIGTDASGASPLPNLETGIFIDGAFHDNRIGARNSVVGGTAAGAGNRIAFNGRSGVAIGPYTSSGVFSTGNRLRGNSIYSNGLLGIDLVASSASESLDADGPALNDEGDSDAGPNGMQNAPTVVAVEAAGGTTSVRGRLDSAPNRTYAIDLFASASCDPSGYGEGQTYLGSTQATTDASGVATFSGSFPTPSSPGQVFTATATDAAGNTSEFSACHDGNAADTVQFTSPSYTTDEAKAARVIVSRTLGTAGAVTVDYATSDITAKAGADYVAASGTLQFAPGETSKAVDVTVIDDELNENKESFRLTLSNPTGGISLGTNTASDVHVLDNDPVPAVFVADATVAEGDSGTAAASFTVTLSDPSALTVGVSYSTSAGTAAAGGDYTHTSGRLTFAPGETSKTVEVPVLGDTTPEPNETFNLNLVDGSNSLVIDPLGVGTILNDDAALRINDLRAGEGDTGQTAFDFTVSIPFPTVNVVSVNYATADGTAAAGSDYAAASGTLTFAAGETAKTVTANVNGDAADEPDETFFVNLSSAAHATVADSQGQGTITNDDSATSLRFSQASFPASESAHFVTVTVTRTGGTSSAAGVDFATSDGTATERRDYTAVSGRLQFAAGETSKTFDVLLTEDAYTEAEETINLTLSNPTGASLGDRPTAAVSIAADDNPPPNINPIEVSPDFVRQHYHDFLNREPDAEGLAFWTNDIEQCGADALCREVKRVNVSAAFFLSIEFQQTGYLVYRTYKAAYGDATSPNVTGTVPVVRLQEFLPDTRRIGGGVVVGPAGWEQRLEDNKNAYMAEFVSRTRFLTAFPVSMTAAEFVDKLNQNAGGVLTQAEREQFVAQLSPDPSGTAARAAVLRGVSENAALRQNEFRRAFVLMQFYGYLRRNPDDPQDTDFRGWKFWLDKLNQFDGNYVQAEMVKAFLSSDEYRRRFGQ